MIRRLSRLSQAAVPLNLSKSKRYDPTQIPAAADDISVRWVLKGTPLWWKATVISSAVSNNPPILRSGVLQHSPRQGYDRKVCEVEFLFSLEGGKMIRDKRYYSINSWVFEYEDCAKDKDCEYDNIGDDNICGRQK